MPAAVAERVYWAIINLPANLSPELCEAVEDFYRYVRLRGSRPSEPGETTEQLHRRVQEAESETARLRAALHGVARQKSLVAPRVWQAVEQALGETAR